MQLLRKLLDNLAGVWNKSAKETTLFTIAQNTGTHSKVTVSEGALYFHTAPYRSDLPVKQTILLQNMNVTDLITTINGMGYTATLDAGATGLATMKAYILLEVNDIPLTASLQAFDSMTWKLMYPIYRVLRQAEFDVDSAIKQLNVTTASGSWLDYWATFFSITRNAGEADNDFVRRFLMWLFNPKTNNMALKELLAYQLKDNNIFVDDDSAGKFRVTVDQKYLTNAGDLNNIILSAKAAGIQYFLAYSIAPYTENYPVYLSNITGIPLANLDVGTGSLQTTNTEAYTTPVESRSASQSVTLSEAFAAPTDLLRPGTTTRTLTETWLSPVELLSDALQLALSETWVAPLELINPSMTTTNNETFTTLQSNLDSCFTLNSSSLNLDELLTGKAAEVVTATLTLASDGSLIRQVSI